MNEMRIYCKIMALGLYLFGISGHPASNFHFSVPLAISVKIHIMKNVCTRFVRFAGLCQSLKERFAMLKSRLSALLAAVLLLSSSAACAEGFTPLDMNSTAIAPAPKDECYLSDNEYKDDSIHVEISEGEYDGVHYTVAHVTISDPSQLRTIPAAQVNNPGAGFSAWSSNVAPAARMAQAANAVVAINGDFISISDMCQIALRQGQQIRNLGNGSFDVLVVDRNGDFTILPSCTKQDYAAYYETNADSLYQVFCFGPALVMDGKSAVPENYRNGYIISAKQTQRVAVAQIGPLEYAIITCDGDAMFYKFGLTLYSFSLLCEEIGTQFSPEGFKVAYNFDGGNSATLVFKRRDENGTLAYRKLNMPERERDLADMICFVSLVP